MLLYSLKLRRKLRKMKLKLSKILRKAIEEATYRREIEIKRKYRNLKTYTSQHFNGRCYKVY